VGGQLGVKPI